MALSLCTIAVPEAGRLSWSQPGWGALGFLNKAPNARLCDLSGLPEMASSEFPIAGSVQLPNFSVFYLRLFHLTASLVGVMVHFPWMVSRCWLLPTDRLESGAAPAPPTSGLKPAAFAYQCSEGRHQNGPQAQALGIFTHMHVCPFSCLPLTLLRLKKEKHQPAAHSSELPLN